MYGGITLLNDRTLYERFTKAREPQRMELLFEMARRIWTAGAMMVDMYREDMSFRRSVDDDTVRLFVKYRLNSGQE